MEPEKKVYFTPRLIEHGLVVQLTRTYPVGPGSNVPSSNVVRHDPVPPPSPISAPAVSPEKGQADAPPGQADAPPGQADAPPNGAQKSQADAPPGQADAPSGDNRRDGDHNGSVREQRK